jgi:toxin ParE1/3/4
LNRSFTILIENRAEQDIQQAYNYYEAQQVGLGVRFNQSVFQSIDVLRQSPFFQIRYDKFRCLPLKGFPYMIHFEVDEVNFNVTIYAVIHTHRNPIASWLK